MKTSVELDKDLAAKIEHTVSIVGEKSAIVLRMVIRAGLPLVASSFQSPRPEGYFSDAYSNMPEECSALENSVAKSKNRATTTAK